MDLDPEVGQYRLSADVAGVEVNALRETLGVRPQPFPINGLLRGIVHCTGPLQEPLFSGQHFAVPHAPPLPLHPNASIPVVWLEGGAWCLSVCSNMIAHQCIQAQLGTSEV